MRSLLATRCIASALALALSISPALAGGPGCCRGQAANAATGCPCCQQRAAAEHASADSEDDEVPGCCAAKHKACCARAEEPAGSTQVGLAVQPASSKCCCKARAPLPAVSETQFDLRIKHELLATAHVDAAPKAQMYETLALHRGGHEIPPAPSLQKLLCRWVV